MKDLGEIDDIQDRILVGKMLSIVAANVTGSLGSYSNWLLAGFGAAFALILPEIESITKYISIDTIKKSMYFYLFAFSIGVFEKYIESIVKASTLSPDDSKTIAENSEGVDLENVINQMASAYFYPQRLLVARQLRKILAGDLSLSGRIQIKMAQIHGLLVLLQAGLLVSSVIILINGL